MKTVILLYAVQGSVGLDGQSDTIMVAVTTLVMAMYKVLKIQLACMLTDSITPFLVSTAYTHKSTDTLVYKY